MDMDQLEQHVECPGCGQVFSAPNLRQISLSIEPAEGDGVAIVSRLDTWLQHRRDVLHACPGGGGGGDGALMPAWPPDAPPARDARVALDPPGTD
jgi:hypothetical protein